MNSLDNLNLLLIIIPTLLIVLSQAFINNSYKKYQKIKIKSNCTGSDAAKKILNYFDLDDVEIKKISGSLTDNFNPKTNVISLSQDIFENSSISSVAVAAHECGHVIQHKEKYFFIVLRSFLVPIVNLTSKLGYAVMVISVIANLLDIAIFGLILMCASLVFQLITLPTEFDASRRARKALLELNIVTKEELPKVNTMLTSAAFTYVASFFASIAQMLRLYLNINNRK